MDNQPPTTPGNERGVRKSTLLIWSPLICMAVWLLDMTTFIGCKGSPFEELRECGFLLSPFMIASLAFGLFLRAKEDRLARRRACGSCLQCGYSLVGIAIGAPCPECGHRKDKE